MTNRPPNSLNDKAAESVDDLLVTLDQHAGIVFANDAWSTQLGHDPEEVSGRPFYDFVALDVRRNLQRFLADLPPAPISASTVLLTSESERRRYNATWTTRASKTGPLLLDGTFTGPLAARRSAPVEEHAPMPIADGEWEWLLQEDIVVFSEGWSTLFGGPAIEQVCGPEEWFERVLEEDVDRLESALDAHLSGHTPSLDVIFRAVGDDGVVRRVRCFGRCERNEDGVPRRLVGVVSLADAFQTAEEQVSLGDALTQALELGEIEARYLPVVDPETGVLVAVHCTPCWIDERRGEVGHRRVVAAATAIGRLADVEAAVIHSLVSVSSTWRASGTLRTGIRWSVSVDGLLAAGADLEGLLGPEGERLSSWTICISEATVAESADDALDRLQRCRDRGAHVCVRDFGVGDMPLSYLKQDIVDRLCLHESLVARLGIETAESRVVAAMLNLARSFDLLVLATGVSDKRQRAALATLGCVGIDGPLIEHPLRADAIGRHLRLGAGRRWHATPPQSHSVS